MNRLICGLYEFRRIPEGSKLWFKEEKQGYTVIASNIAFCVCTKPMNALKTVLYTIVDWERGIRGPEDLVFGMGAESEQDCREMLQRLTEGDSEVSTRHQAPLNIIKYYNPVLGKTYPTEKEENI